MPIAFEKLPALPDCVYLKDGRCDVLGLDINLMVCSFCKRVGPFCGKSVSSQEKEFFIKTAPVYAGVLVERKTDKVNVFSPIREGWSKVATTWRTADSFLRSMSSRGLQSSRVSNDLLIRRMASCFGDVSRNLPACQYMTKKETGSYCSACGCGQNKIARLDEGVAGGYTKLHYPYLECPIGRDGFSNATVRVLKPAMSIIIPVCNDEKEVNLTIQSIRSSGGQGCEIIVVDDYSDTPVTLSDKSAVLVRNERRLGAGASRHKGILLSKSNYIFLTDSHMRFSPGWLEACQSRLDSTPNTIWCGACLGLSECSMDIQQPVGVYTGANMVFYNPSPRMVFEGIWREDVPDRDDYEISCLMGACYFTRKDWFLHIGGLAGNKFWGSEEPFLSLKSWLAGGDVRLAKSVRIGHQFRDSAPYTTDIRYPAYNKIRSIMVTLPEKAGNRLISLMPEAPAAMPLVQQDLVEIEVERKYYRSVAKRDIAWFCEKFGITTFN